MIDPLSWLVGSWRPAVRGLVRACHGHSARANLPDDGGFGWSRHQRLCGMLIRHTGRDHRTGQETCTYSSCCSDIASERDVPGISAPHLVARRTFRLGVRCLVLLCIPLTLGVACMSSRVHSRNCNSIAIPGTSQLHSLLPLQNVPHCHDPSSHDLRLRGGYIIPVACDACTQGHVAIPLVLHNESKKPISIIAEDLPWKASQLEHYVLLRGGESVPVDGLVQLGLFEHGTSTLDASGTLMGELQVWGLTPGDYVLHSEGIVMETMSSDGSRSHCIVILEAVHFRIASPASLYLRAGSR